MIKPSTISLSRKYSIGAISLVAISIFFISTLLSTISNNSDASSNIFYVDDSGGENYTSIQAAINDANDGDIVYVYEGIYQENIILNKTITLQGENKKAIIDAASSSDVVTVFKNNASISGFTIINSGNGSYGIKLYGVDNCTIKNCNISSNYAGIGIFWSDNNFIMRNFLSGNVYAILSTSGKYNKIEENIFSGNTNAVRFGGSSYTSYNIIRYNNFFSNSVDAIDEGYSNYWDYEHIGNYWDKYTGNDADADGIGDIPYTITGDVKDHYPLMEPYAGYDIFPPDIMNLKANPQIQIPNGTVNITCEIIDNVEVNVAYLNITMPNGTYMNESLEKINLTDLYYFNRSFSRKGVYQYYIWTNDTSDNSEKSVIKQFVIAYKPTAYFTYAPSSNITDLTIITFDGSNSSDPDGSITNYTWNFGDGKKAYGTIVTHKYDDDGNYNVSLTVIDNDGAWDIMTKEIFVANIPPVANFSYTPNASYIIVGQQVNFTDTSYDVDGFIWEWKWDFGDGNIYIDHTGVSPTHAYAVNGVFNVTLTVKDNDFSSGSVTKRITVKDLSPPRIKNLTAYPNPQEIYGIVNITCLVIDNVNVNVVKMNITDPYGNFSIKEMKNIKNSSIYYYVSNYSIEGNYSYFIWANDTSDNANFSLIHTFTIIIPAEPPEIKNVNAIPMQQEYGSSVNISAYVTDNVEVADARIVIKDPKGSIVGNFSMNSFSIDEKGNGWYYYNSTYVHLGNYTYLIWAVDINGYTNQSEEEIFRIVDTTPPEITNVNAPQLQEPNKEVNISCTITDNMDVSIANITIELPNGTMLEYSMDTIPPLYWINKTYTLLGRYNYSIQTFDSMDNSAHYNGTFIITFFPVANFTWQPKNPTDLDDIVFNASLSYDFDGFISNYTWVFGDGNYSYEKNPQHKYPEDGAYNVILTVKDNDGAVASIQKQITVSNVPPVANFSYSPTNSTTQDMIQFIDNSNDLDGFITNYTWDFGDGDFAYGAMVSHRYADDGIYNVTLTVKDDNGATGSVVKLIIISNVPPSANFSFSMDNLSVSFQDESFDPDGFITNWSWDFGDGEMGYGKTVNHTYESNAIYQVTLTIKDDDDALANITKNITLTDTQSPSVTVNTPNGGETWAIGTIHYILWTATDNIGVTSIDIYYSTDGGLTYPYTIVTGTANDGIYLWTVPNTPSTTCKVKVVAHDASGNMGEDVSNDNFEIIISSTHKGDFDGDNDCDWEDFLEFADAYNSRCGDLNYDPIGDFNDDCRINWEDFLEFADIYNTSW